MSFLSRLFGSPTSKRDQLRPLWFRVVELSRIPEYYSENNVADTVEGRFDMILHIMVLVTLRMENSRALTKKTALLTELFVSDMDGQLRESGVGDVGVSKHMGKLMGALGGRLGALRGAFDSQDNGPLAEGLMRNVSWAENADVDASAAGLAVKLRALHDDLAARSNDQILFGDFAK